MVNTSKCRVSINFPAVFTAMCRQTHEDDQDVTTEDCETELSIIWSDFLLVSCLGFMVIS